MTNGAATSSVIERLPEEFRTAQEAMDLPEVQEMMKRLAKYNLGICMPHMHTEEEEFAHLPEDMVQVEQDLKVHFAARGKSENVNSIPVAWRWSDGVIQGAICTSQCEPSSTPDGSERHVKIHGR